MQPVPFEEFTRRVLPLYSPPIRRRRTREKMVQALNEFAPLCPDTSAINVEAVAAWIAGRPDRSAIASWSLLRSFAAAVRTGHEELTVRLDGGAVAPLVPFNLFQGRPPCRWWPEGELEVPEKVRHLSADEARRLLEHADRRVRESSGLPDRWLALRLSTLIRICLFTGMRRSEALGLKRADLDLVAGAIEVRPNERRHLKPGAGRRRAPIPRGLAPALEEWNNLLTADPVDPHQPWLVPNVTRSGPWFGGPYGKRPIDEVKALGLEAGLPGLTILMLRHTFATLLESLDFGELLRQRLLGHRRRATQFGYGHEDAAILRGAGARVTL